MKKIQMIRHGFKDATGNHITAECLNDIRKNGIAGVGLFNKFHKGSACVRTFETGEACVSWKAKNGGGVDTEYIEIDPRFGSDALFAEMVIDEFKKRKKETGKGNFEVLQETSSFNDFERWTNDMYKALEYAFLKLNNNDTCLLVSHSPTIEMLVNKILGGNLVDLKIKELEGVTFVLSADGSVSVKNLLGYYQE
ncbi:hypothetical protein ACFL23_01025 [Patescibacteria group bacterium]